MSYTWTPADPSQLLQALSNQSAGSKMTLLGIGKNHPVLFNFPPLLHRNLFFVPWRGWGPTPFLRPSRMCWLHKSSIRARGGRQVSLPSIMLQTCMSITMRQLAIRKLIDIVVRSLSLWRLRSWSRVSLKCTRREPLSSPTKTLYTVRSKRALSLYLTSHRAYHKPARLNQ